MEDLVYGENVFLGKVHFIAIGGVGMSAIARVLLSLGVEVSGSDVVDSKVLQQLRDLGADIFVGHRAENLVNVNMVVVSSAIAVDNIELVEAKSLGLKVLHRSQALALLVVGKKLLAVSGTHGKTTTSAMLSTILLFSGFDPSFVVGGSVSSLGVNAFVGGSDLFVIEADESDGSFLNFFPSLTVVTNVEADHLDHYGSSFAFEAAFEKFVFQVVDKGSVVACLDDFGANSLIEKLLVSGRRVLTYGLSTSADFCLKNIDTKNLGVSFDLYSKDGFFGLCDVSEVKVSLQVPGVYNALNSVAAIVAALDVGVCLADAVAGVESFSGVARRFELVGEKLGVKVYDDYAHHPTEVEAALRAAKEVAGGGKVFVVFQPHLYSRTKFFVQEFAQALAIADVVVVTGIYGAREAPVVGVSGKLIVDCMELIGKVGYYFENFLDSSDFVANHVSAGDIVMTVGAGSITVLGAKILQSLGSQE